MMISVALCSYNGARFLEEQLTSIANQTRQPDEVIICDDCSQDSSVSVARAFTDRATFAVRLICNKTRLGTTKNFEQAISRCGGDVIALADQDDVWLETKLASIEAAFLMSPQAGMVMSDADVVEADLSPTGYRLWQLIGFTPADQHQVNEGHALNVLLRQNVVTGATAAFRSWLRRLCLPIPGEWVHDAWIGLLISAAASIVCLPDPLVKYRQHRNQIGVRKRCYVERVITASRERRDTFLSALERFRSVEARLACTDCPPVSGEARAKMHEKMQHLEVRTRMPRHKWERPRSIVQELKSGRYHRYSFGLQSALADAFRPA